MNHFVVHGDRKVTEVTRFSNPPLGVIRFLRSEKN